jgi:glycosyltransferase involved in cell wall biosynthesis
MSSQPLVSFVVLNYNNGRYLRECLDSILTQETEYEFEIVLVDDASSDDSVEIASSYSDPRVRFIQHRENQGHIAAVQNGLHNARGAYIARIDSDDRYRPGFLATTIPLLESYLEVGLVYCDATIINEQGEMTVDRSDDIHSVQDFKGNEFVQLLEQNFICAPTVIARREAWLKTLPIPEHLAFHDWYFTLMMAREWDFYHCHQLTADYRVHSGNLHTRISRDKSEEASIFWLLDRIFSEIELKPELERGKHAARQQVYGAHYLLIAMKYFGFGMYGDARRCYLQSIYLRPAYMLRLDVLRYLGATLVGQKFYERSKSLVKMITHQAHSLLKKAARQTKPPVSI